jgi:hypothetical protein
MGQDGGVTTVGAVFLPQVPPERLRPVAEAADRAGLAQLWLWEDCFWTSGVAAASAALAWTERLQVGVGLLPVPLRNVTITAVDSANPRPSLEGSYCVGLGAPRRPMRPPKRGSFCKTSQQQLLIFRFRRCANPPLPVEIERESGRPAGPGPGCYASPGGRARAAG